MSPPQPVVPQLCEQLGLASLPASRRRPSIFGASASLAGRDPCEGWCRPVERDFPVERRGLVQACPPALAHPPALLTSPQTELTPPHARVRPSARTAAGRCPGRAPRRL